MTSRQIKNLESKLKETLPHKKNMKSKRKEDKKSSKMGDIPHSTLFGSFKLSSTHQKKQSDLYSLQGITRSHKIITTDESNNGYESKINQSVLHLPNNMPNGQYFQYPSFKERMQKCGKSIGSSQSNSRIKNMSCKIEKMKHLLLNQNQQISRMKGAVSDKELHRLIKMQSIQRLKVISSINKKTPAKKKKV